MAVEVMVTPAGQGERPAESEHDHGEHRAGPDSGIAPVKASAMVTRPPAGGIVAVSCALESPGVRDDGPTDP